MAIYPNYTTVHADRSVVDKEDDPDLYFKSEPMRINNYQAREPWNAKKLASSHFFFRRRCEITPSVSSSSKTPRRS